MGTAVNLSPLRGTFAKGNATRSAQREVRVNGIFWAVSQGWCLALR